MNKKILFAIIPKGYWIILAISIMFVLLGTQYTALSNIGINFLLFLIGYKIAIFIHEIGHLSFAWLARGTPKRLVLGRGHKIAETRFKGIKVILNNNVNSGLAYAAFDDLRFIRLKLLVYISGGFLTNFLIAGILYKMFDFTTNATDAIHPASALGIANLFAGISVLIPRHSFYQGLRLSSDGLAILKIPFHKKAHLLELSSANEFLDGMDLFESKKYKEAIDIFEKLLVKTEGSKLANINLSTAHMKLGNYEKAVALMEEVLPMVNEQPYKDYKNYIYNGIAWVYLIMNRLEEADKYSEFAYSENRNSEHIRGTRASVLIEKGHFRDGINLLINDVDFNFPNNQTLAAAIYIGLAFHELNEPLNAEQYVTFVEENLGLLDADERLLYERAKEKWRHKSNAEKEYVN